ncbi:Metallo-dependent phosphatase-like protein [Podospora appendiculata]|uniref:Metallo-dependent phosphatase-like protein n=1 Tax=Podospora appendiculata TaxID=314037 RepID=A0AAE1C7Y7_9PEZI|nr:Metallo-dependent phosphatase-like protein [Podospora appendiculata]
MKQGVNHIDVSSLDDIVHRTRPNACHLFWRAPVVYMARKLYMYSQPSPHETPSRGPRISIVCISDTHNTQPVLPHGDVLIHAGDLTQSGSFSELQTTLDWLQSQPHAHKIVVAGNHDLLRDSSRDKIHNAARERLRWGDIIYLQDSSTTIHVVSPGTSESRAIKVHGSPRTPWNGNWAFQYTRADDVWGGTIPEDTDVLITHGPPRAHLDLLNLGCGHLLRELWRVRPRLHVFGHVHEGHGTEWVRFDGLQEAYERAVVCSGGLGNLGVVMWEFGTLLVNAAVVGGLRDLEMRAPVKVYI